MPKMRGTTTAQRHPGLIFFIDSEPCGFSILHPALRFCVAIPSMEKKSSNSEQESTTSYAELTQIVEKKVTKALQVVLWDQLPSWQQDNHYIRSGYRLPSGSYLGSFQSLGYLHNETVNVYSHLIGAIVAILAAVLLFSALGKRYPLADMDDILVLSCYFLGAVACLGMSATYHLLQNHSEVVARFGNKLDYLGIVSLIWGSFFPSVYYGFRNDERLMKIYWAMVRYLQTLYEHLLLIFIVILRLQR